MLNIGNFGEPLYPPFLSSKFNMMLCKIGSSSWVSTKDFFNSKLLDIMDDCLIIYFWKVSSSHKWYGILIQEHS